MPLNIVRVDPSTPHYDFDSLKPGDALEVKSMSGAREMFRRWRKRTGRQARLVTSNEFPTLLIFVDETVV